MGITTKAPASKRISFPKLGRLALPSNGTPMYSWQCVSAITFALGRCADIAESLSTEQRRGSWTWSVKLWGRLRRSIPQDLDQTDTVTPEDPEMADSRPPPTPVLRNDQVLKELLDLSELLVAGGNELGKAILERRRAWDWRAGRFRGTSNIVFTGNKTLRLTLDVKPATSILRMEVSKES